MNHEQPRIARRSASHGALSSSYTAHTCASSESGHGHLPTFKPLRSIREHGHTFLDPAASADGMLRKTTETGNIGIFSMYAGRPSPLRSRASLGDLRQPPRPFSRSSDRPPGHDDRRRLPSYRDSTSEIISMYGSENQSSSKSASGTLSPPWDDSGQRSYSMTTYGSKSQAMPRNYGIQQAHEFHAKGQRPRSPYPYPTRLPRPGFRPSSPALTENGHVDYSRMVEINRFPERTTLHPKALFPYKTTRNPPPPLSMRCDINQSTRSLTDDHVPARPYPLPLSRRPPLPTHLHPWAPIPRDRLENRSSDQSLRTTSLTSTSGGYGCALHIPRLPPPKAKPIFYDYSEDFETAVEPTPDYPIAPTPQRVSSSLRSMIASGCCDTNLESADEGAGDVVEYLRRATMIDGVKDDEYFDNEHDNPVSHLESTDEPVKPDSCEPIDDDAFASSFVLPEFFHEIKDSHPSNTAPKKHHEAAKESRSEEPEHTTEVVSNCLASETSTLESPLEPKTPALDFQTTLPELERHEDRQTLSLGCQDHNDVAEDNSAPAEVVEKLPDRSEPVTIIIPRPELTSATSTTFPYRYSFGRKDSRFFSLSSGLSDLASFVNCIDKHIQAPNPEEVDRSEISVVPSSKTEPNPDHRWNSSQGAQETPAPLRKPSLQRFRGDCVESASNTTGPVDELQQYKVISTRTGPTLVPQPISPAKMLRVKNSIPQLMKALPPLPDYDPAPDSPFGPAIVPIDIEPFELSRLTDARSTLSDAMVSPKRDKEVVKRYDTYIFDHAARKPKLKLKHAASFSPGNPRHLRRAQMDLEQSDAVLPEYLARRPSTATEYSTAPCKRRLPIRVSRPTFTSLTPEDTGTVKRRSVINKSSTISELASVQPLDLFSTSAGSKVAVHDTQPFQVESIPPNIHEQSSGPTRIANNAGRNQQIFPDDARGTSLDSQLGYWHSPSSGTEEVVEGRAMQNFSENSVSRSQQGPRKTISNLRSKVTESRQHQRSPLGTSPHEEDGDAKGPLLAAETVSSNTFKNLLSGSNQCEDNRAVAPVQKFRKKLEKLMRGAKHKLRTWGKRKHRVG